MKSKPKRLPDAKKLLKRCARFLENYDIVNSPIAFDAQRLRKAIQAFLRKSR